MSVHDESDGQNAVQNRVHGSDGRRSDEGNEGRTEEPLKGPVVRSVGLVGRGEDGRVVYCSYDVWFGFGLGVSSGRFGGGVGWKRDQGKERGTNRIERV